MKCVWAWLLFAGFPQASGWLPAWAVSFGCAKAAGRLPGEFRKGSSRSEILCVWTGAARCAAIEVIVFLQLSMRAIGGRAAALARQRVLLVCETARLNLHP
jgi:hypothetical protein